MKRCNLWMPQPLTIKIKKAARKECTTFSQWLRTAAMERLRRIKQKELAA